MKFYHMKDFDSQIQYDADIILFDVEKIPSDCSFPSLQYAIFTDKVQIIGRYAFSKAPKLASVQFNYGLKRIEDFAFENCKLTSDIILPLSVVHVGIGAFKNSTQNEGENRLLYVDQDSLSFYPHDSDKKIGFHFYNCEKLTALKPIKKVTREERIGFIFENFILSIIDDKEKGVYDLKL